MPKKELYILEYSKYSKKKKMFPYHVQPLSDAIGDNALLHDDEPDNNNQWIPIFSGTRLKCFEILKKIVEKK